MRTPYKIDDVQALYFVISSLQALLDATAGTDFTPVYDALAKSDDIPIEALLTNDVLATGM